MILLQSTPMLYEDQFETLLLSNPEVWQLEHFLLSEYPDSIIAHRIVALRETKENVMLYD